MKTKIKTISLIALSLLYPYLLIDLMFDETAPWKPLFANSSFLSNNWVSLIILMGYFTGLLFLGKSLFDEKKDEQNVILKFVYQNVISLSILIFMYVFSIFMIVLLSGSSIAYLSILFILIFPICFTLYHYLFIFKREQNTFVYNQNLLYLFLGVVLPVIIYGLLAAVVI